MTDALKGKTVAEADALFERFHQLVTSDPDAAPDTSGLGKLAVFAGVREHPSRDQVRHALLAHAQGGGRRAARRGLHGVTVTARE